ncbi:pyridoxal phosphate-dependent aminotransferase [uncultured Desulfuromonas sp.]|uniref:pyridoxal phosphate-dependent aminotransferase n=1 Tax=uncultured Desulfuromonas sp. TaxID=181013 RepID=UPI002AAAA396|nr:pyridoxal phosphate-dependent aminotransferase [uncultured Desulfuromonas sp.]
MSQTFDFDQVIDRHGSDSLKWGIYPPEILPMWVADMDFTSPPEVLTALHQRIDHGVFGYALATQEVTDSVVNWLQQRYDWTIDPQWLIWLPGLVPALHAACHAFTQADQEVVTFSPVYPPFRSAPKTCQRPHRDIPLTRDHGRYTFDLQRFDDQLTDKSRLLLLCHPHNPVGRAFEKQELTALAEQCIKHNLIICSDEIHCDLVLNHTRHIPFACLNEEITQRTITLMSAAKTFNIAGLNCGFAIIPNPTLRRQFNRAAQGMIPHPNALGYAATQAAFSHAEPWRQALLEYLRVNRDYLHKEINQRLPMLTMEPVEATYLAWINVSALEDYRPAFFEQAGLGFSAGEPFGDNRFMRLNFGCSRSTLEEALQRLERAISPR